MILSAAGSGAAGDRAEGVRRDATCECRETDGVTFGLARGCGRIDGGAADVVGPPCCSTLRSCEAALSLAGGSGVIWSVRSNERSLSCQCVAERRCAAENDCRQRAGRLARCCGWICFH